MLQFLKNWASEQSGVSKLRSLPTNVPANTLIIAILLTTLMIFIAVGVLTLIIQGSLTIGSLESATRAIFASDSGVEIGLLHVKNHQPGYEEDFNNIKLGLTNIDASVKSQTLCMPNEDGCPQPAALPNKIEGNQSASIPLFKDTSKGLKAPSDSDISDGQNFTFSFHGDGGDAQFQWKILGTTSGNTESITEYIDTSLPANTISPNTLTQDDKGNIEVAGVTTSGSIHDFLQAHKQNYLVITNVSPTGVPILWNIKYTDKLADDKFTVLSTGSHQGYTQTQQVEVPLGEFLPFFHYAIFSPN